MQKTEIDWQFYTESNDSCLGQTTQGCFWPRGKVLGGSSTINYMLYVRGNPADFNRWSELGNVGWDYENVLPYFKKLELNHHEDFVNYKNGKYHSADGLQNIDFFATDGTESQRELLLKAAIEAGNPHIDDINADIGLGYLNLQGFHYDGFRQSAAKSYLVPAKKRRNLHVIKNAMAQKVLIDENNKAYGVEFLYNGNKNFKAIAKKEVIVSCGSVMSPHLLMLSGIGPKEQLEPLGIEVKSDLAVGKNLIDHPGVTLWFRFDPTSTSPLNVLETVTQYITTRTGYLSSIGATQFSGFINTVNGTGAPDFQLQFFYFTKSSYQLPFFLNIFNYVDDLKQKLLSENDHLNSGRSFT